MEAEETERSGLYTIVIDLSIALGSRDANDAAAREYADGAAMVCHTGTRVISSRALKSLER